MAEMPAGFRFISDKKGTKVDIVPLVQCKNCKHGRNSIWSFEEKRIFIDCDKKETHDPDWFCADGEKKDNG